jgi:hypothetical protein
MFLCGGGIFLTSAAFTFATCSEWGTPVCTSWGSADTKCNCVPGSYDPITNEYGSVTCDICDFSSICNQYTTPCVGTSATVACGSNQYACNKLYGCCDVGTAGATSTGGGCTYTCQTACSDSQIGAGTCGTAKNPGWMCGDYSACYVCYNSSPAAPTAISPLTVPAYTEKKVAVTLTWSAVTSWGTECTSNIRGYQVCVGPNASDPCSGTGSQVVFVPGAATTTVNVANMSSAINYWQVRAKNAADQYSGWSSANRFCYWGSNSRDPLAVTTWSSCDPTTHIRTRSCIDGCDCTGIRMSEVCEATIQGTIFDASYLNSCPVDTNSDGYANDTLTADEYSQIQSFSISDEDNSPPVGTPSGTYVIKTAKTGNYRALVYAGGDAASGAPVQYSYDFSQLSHDFDIAAGPKLLCNNAASASATVWSNDQTCLYQPCTVVKNQNFGFYRIFGGWWQAIGGNVYGANGIRSYIPPSTSTQQLILADAKDNGRVGFLAYGTKLEDEIGYNPNARISSKLWEIQSLYQGLRYDYNFYNTRMDIFASTAWDGGDLNYEDKGVGYQIFKHTGDVTLSALSLTGTEKVILLVNGNVTVNGDITVANGAFLGIIAKGNITFNANVAKAQGWFVAENINVPCHDGNSDGTCDRDDVQFLGEGSFVGWTNINLGRDRYKTNNLEPSETFTYRPDLFMNVPKPMKVYTRKFSSFVP